MLQVESLLDIHGGIKSFLCDADVCERLIGPLFDILGRVPLFLAGHLRNQGLLHLAGFRDAMWA